MISEAFALAAELHRSQVRKGTTIPYISHLLAVSALVLEDGGSGEAAAAALLHDAAEDQGGWPTVERIRGTCGDEVAKLVVECSDSIGPVGEEKAPWRIRKQAAIDGLPGHTRDALLIIAADKLHNARATLTDLKLSGPGVWDRFKTGRSGFLWYHREVAKALDFLLPGSRSVSQLKTVVVALEQSAGGVTS